MGWSGRRGRDDRPRPLRPLLRRMLAPDPDSMDDADARRPDNLAPAQARLLAAMVDVSLVAVALYWFGGIGHDAAFDGGGSALLLLTRLSVWLGVMAVPVVMEGSTGQTPGKRLFAIRVVSVTTGRPPGWRAAAHRGAARALFWCVSFLALTDPLAQTLHDRSAGTIVIHSPDPVDAPKLSSTADGAI